eukprot:COSAG01_NODE_21224_length_912_cov_1.252153_2_plen_67_part_00
MDYTLGFDSSGGLWNYSSWVPVRDPVLDPPHPRLAQRTDCDWGFPYGKRLFCLKAKVESAPGRTQL